MSSKTYFTETLLQWHHSDNDRSLPWKEEKDPYKIWLSEIILQQTRAEQGREYYLKFIKNYPNIHSLANASFEAVMKDWQGLGYYSRCANLYKTANIISKEKDGIFPNTYEEIIKLPGIGPYTAAAISSFAFEEPKAVLDGNVYRVLSRYFGLKEAIDDNQGKKVFSELAQQLIPKHSPSIYNQAIMDFGATMCKPQNPNCEKCLLATNCKAFEEDLVSLLPIKKKSIKKRTRHFHYILLSFSDRIYIQKRTQKDIWQNLHEPFLIESQNEEIQNYPEWLKMEELKKVGTLTQTLTHQFIITHWYEYKLNKIEDSVFPKESYLSKNNLKKIAFPKSIFSFMSENNYF